MNKFEVGTVFRWINFPDPRGPIPDIKPRWLIYLGGTGALSQVKLAYICTTTTQKHHFEPGGSRQKHDTIKFQKSAALFESDCILDCDEAPFPISLSKLENEKNVLVEKLMMEGD